MVLFASACIEARRWKFYTEKMLPGSKQTSHFRKEINRSRRFCSTAGMPGGIRGERKNWILLKTVGKKSNRNGIGARVTIFAAGHRQLDEVRSGGSYISQNDLRLHFGIGDATKVERAEVLWPSGIKVFSRT